MSLLPGTEVTARGLRWEVVHVESLGMQSRYRLRGLEAAVQAEEIDLISPFEDIDPIIHDFRPERAAPLANWLVYHQAFLLEQALGPNALLSVQPGRLQIQPYQLVPVIRAIRMSRVRLMLADGVGLGKTVQAGLVLTELMARRIAHRVLIVSPAGPLLEQWKTEMLERFGLRLDHIDRARFEEIRRSQELGANPFDHAALAIASVDFLKQERVLDQLERAVYDVIVLDEAHHCMDLGVRSNIDREVSDACYRNGRLLGDVLRSWSMELGVQLDMTRDSKRFAQTSSVVGDRVDPRDPGTAANLLQQGFLVLHEGKTFRQFDDQWGETPRYVVPIETLLDRRGVLRDARFYRLAHRIIAGPGDQNVAIWVLHPPGVVCGNSCATEKCPKRANAVALYLLGMANTFCFDYLLCLRVRANVLAFMRDAQPIPLATAHSFATHSALRLTCNHAGYEPLWREQLGDAWREDNPSFTWPVLAGDDKRWAVRAAIDAVVADAYGLSRDQYEHVLSTFSHASYRSAPKLCLERFDELKAIGLEAFTRKYDPYWDIPLNENLPQPVIDLPIPEEQAPAQLTLWQERDGQMSLNAPGPLFDVAAEEKQTRAGGNAATRRTGDSGDGDGAVKRTRQSRQTAAVSDEPANERTFEQLLGYLRTQGSITSADAQELLGLSATDIRPLLKRLVDEGHARTQGAGRGTKYVS